MPADQEQQPFVHLHVHTEFSLLDGLSKIDKLVAHAKDMGMKSLAITDHGVMHGVVNFYRACTKAGIKPIIGMEGYLARKSMHIHDASEKSPYHLLLLAKNEIGYKNLLKIASEAQLEGFYSKPRIDKERLAEHAEGLICTSGCLAAEIPRMVMDGHEDEAREAIGWYQDVFGKENFFLEFQQHDIPELLTLNRWLLDNRDFANVPVVATNDVHYVRDTDADPHDTLLCIQTSTLKSDVKRMRMSDPSYFLRSPQQMWEIFHEVPEALLNTSRIAEMCEVNLESKGYHLPVFPVPPGHTADSYLRFLAERGLRWRYGARANNDPTLQTRLDYELGTIHKMGFDTYFLIVWDLCQFARHADIWWNVRGSGAGSVTAYSLGITSIDPIANNLIFERFLNPGRVSMPDIDMDFPDDRRMELINYAMRKYGSNKVAAIITFGTMKARAAIKDVGRVMAYPLETVGNLTKLIPNIPSKPVTLADCLGDDPEKAVPALKELYQDESIKKLLDNALTVEGVARNAGTHAAGVVIGDKPLVEYLPLHRPIGDTKLSQVTQFPMEICESIGLLKVDFLGLSTLTIMRKACELIQKYHGIEFDMSNIPYRPDPDDPESAAKVAKLFELIGNGETTGVFQLESSGMKRMLTEMKPKSFEHIIAAISLYRPGPMELIPSFIKRLHGEEEVVYHHPKLEPVLNETYGICVYQEQIQQIAAQLFGYSLGDADLMRRAVSKKKIKDLMTHKQIFMERGPENGISSDVAEKIFGEIEYFAAYGFNKCVTYNTEIIDAATGRLIRVGDLATGKVHLDETITCDVDHLRLQAGAVTAVYENGVKPVFRLTTNLGRQIEATGNHPFYSLGGWKMLGELKVGDKIAVPRCLPIQGSKEWPDSQLIALAQSVRSESPANVLPPAAFELSNAQIGSLISHIWGLGNCLDNQIVGWHITQSKHLAYQIQHLLLRLGVLSRISTTSHQNIVEYQITVVEDEIRLVETVNDYARWNTVRELATLSYADTTMTSITPQNDVFWDSIVSIESIGEQPTYDLTVPGTHNFVANDIIVHNSHAADYAVLTCQTAYLKAHFPEEYYTALLTVQRDVIADVALFTADCRRFGIPVLPPDVNASDLDFTIEPIPGKKTKDGKPLRGIRYGMGAIKNAGEKAVEPIITARHTGGPFRDIVDFCQRVDLRPVGKRAIESLIKVGAFDSLGLDRDQLVLGIDRITNYSGAYHHTQEIGQFSMFGNDSSEEDAVILPTVPADKITGKRERLAWEKELVGLYVSEHPLTVRLLDIQHLPNIQYSDTLRRDAGQLNERPVTLVGLVVAIRLITTKKGDVMAVVTLEDITGTVDCVLFPRTWKDNQELVKDDALIVVRGKADNSRGEVQVIVDNVSDNFAVVGAADEQGWDRAASTFPAYADTYQSPAREIRTAPAVPTVYPLTAPTSNAIQDTERIGQSLHDQPYAQVSVNDPYNRVPVNDFDPQFEVDFDEEFGEAAPGLPPCMITITFQRTGDPKKDKLHLDRVIRKLVENPGQDRVRFRLVDPQRTVTIAFATPTRYDGEVENFLHAELGAEAIQVEPLDPPR